MRKIVTLLAALATTCSAAGAEQVPVLTMVSHPVADAMIDGIGSELKKNGHSIKLYNPSGDQAMMGQMARQIAGARPKIAVSLLTPPTNVLRTALRGGGTHVYTGVIDRSLVGDDGNDRRYLGVPTAFNYGETASLVKKVLPGARKAGYVLAISEPNAVFAAEELKKTLAAAGITLVTAPVTSASDIRQAAATLAAGCDLIVLGGGNSVISAAPTIIAAAAAKGKPVFACEEGSIAAGAVAGWTTDYHAAGEQTGRVVADLLAGKPAKSTVFAANRLVVNLKAARRLGLNLEPLARQAARVIR